MTVANAKKEQSRLWRIPGIDGVELMRATYIDHVFPRHAHDGFAIGVIEQGALGFYYRGENLIASPGTINLVNPDEVHTGHAVSESGWTYRMFYLDAPLLQKAAGEIADRPAQIPFFQAGVIHDPALADMIRRLHIDSEKKAVSRLESESRLLSMLGQWIMRHADASPSLRSIGRERRPVEKAREYIEEHYNQDVSIEQLSSVANLSPFYLIRSFRRETGLPPHAFQIQVRVRRAKDLVKAGRSLADTAYETGFTDQSHFTRHFKRIVGVPPGKYRNFVQDGRKPEN